MISCAFVVDDQNEPPINAFVTVSKEAVSPFPAVTLLWVLSFCSTCIGHYAPNFAQDAMFRIILQSRVKAVYHSNNKLSRHLVGLWRHTDGLYLVWSLHGEQNIGRGDTFIWMCKGRSCKAVKVHEKYFGYKLKSPWHIAHTIRTLWTFSGVSWTICVLM